MPRKRTVKLGEGVQDVLATIERANNYLQLYHNSVSTAHNMLLRLSDEEQDQTIAARRAMGFTDLG